jgi:parallel beta-helix repeat protein
MQLEEVMKETKTPTRFGYCIAAICATALGLIVTPASASTGTLVLTSSTTLTEDHVGNILVDANNVTLDCANHLVSGPGAPGFNGGIEIAGNLTGVTVKRCAVTGFAVNGIFGGGGASGGRYEANNLYGNGNHGMHLDTGSGYVVLRNTSHSNGAIGIVLTGATQSWIVHNTVEGNRNWAGIALLEGAHDNFVFDNRASRNAIGFVLDGATGNEVRHNTASSNDTEGFVLLRAASNNTLQSNTANQNQVGIQMTDASNSNQINDNIANHNSVTGFRVYQSDYNRLRENTASKNGSFGFLVFGGSSFTTVTDNTAYHNGTLDALDDDSGTGNVWKENQFGRTFGL